MSNSSSTLSLEAGKEVHENEKTYTLAKIVQGLRSDDLNERTTSARAARSMLISVDQISSINLMVTAGVIEPLLEALNRNICDDLQSEAVWAIAIITSGTYKHTMAVVNAGAIPRLVVLKSSGGMVGERCAWALDNISAIAPEMREIVLAYYNALDGMLNWLTLSAPAEQLMTALQSYCNFCRYHKHPLVDIHYVEPALPYISDILESADQDVLATACRALKYLTEDGPECCIEEVQLTPQLLPRLVSLLGHKSSAVQREALATVDNMMLGTDEQIDRCLDAGCLDHFITLLTCGDPVLIKEAAATVSNIFIGTTAQVQRGIDSGVLQHLLNLLATENRKFHKEVKLAIIKLSILATHEQLDGLISGDFLESYCQFLTTPDHRAGLPAVLDGHSYFLRRACEFGILDAVDLRLKEIGALQQIEALQQHENKDIRGSVQYMWKKYFAGKKTRQAAQTEEEYKLGTAGN